MFENKYPYTDFSQLNLDWFLLKFKELLEEQERVSGKVKDLDDTVKEFTDFVTNYFDNLDVQAEVNVKLNEMAADGTLSNLLAPLVAADIGNVVAAQIGDVVDNQIDDVVADQIDAVVADQIDAAVAPEIPGAVTSWLNDNVEPVGSAVVVDSSLSVSGAAADAKTVGDLFNHEHFKSDNLLDITKNTDGVYVWTNGENENASYNASDYIPVMEGQHLYLQYGNKTVIEGRTNMNMVFVVEYDSEKNIIQGLRDQDPYIVPSGVSFIRISAYSSQFNENTYCTLLNCDGTVVDYIPYFEPYDTFILKAECNNDEHINDVINANRHITNGIKFNFDINSDDHIFNNDNEQVQDMFNYSIQFDGRVNTFNGIIVGHGYDTYMGGYVKITPTTFEYYNGTEASPRLSEAHNLTVKDYISVRIDAKQYHVADFTVYTNGGVYTKTNQSWDVRRGDLQVRSDGVNVLNECILSYMCKGWGEKIHLYGDSYFGVYSDKWTQYLVNNGWTGFNLNGYPGRASEEALTILKNVLANSNPEKIIWCLGMNDGDIGGEINPTWKSCVDELMTICSNRGIELILSTIPNVPTVDNIEKNAYVKSSNYRYIDFAAAVGASESSVWFDNMLSVDNVHPSVQGAIALFNQAISDAPELMK